MGGIPSSAEVSPSMTQYMVYFVGYSRDDALSEHRKKTELGRLSSVRDDTPGTIKPLRLHCNCSRMYYNTLATSNVEPAVCTWVPFFPKKVDYLSSRGTASRQCLILGQYDRLVLFDSSR